jgi:MtrB/PioB family decaheme-associated outer membrane protein
MRIRHLLFTAALLVVPAAGLAQAPAKPQPPAQKPADPAPAGTPTAAGLTWNVDVGGLFTTTDGDEARYERYRDDRNGVYTSFSLNRETDSSQFTAQAFHVGYRDQRFGADFFGRKVNASFRWDSLPLNFSYIARTPYVSDHGTLTLDDSPQRAVQGPTIATNDGSAVGVPCAPGAPPASCSNASLAAQAKANRSIYNDLASQFDLRHRRDTASFGLTYAATRSVDIDAKFTSAMREGQQPWGASFAFNNAVELPLPLDQRTNDLSLGATWAKPKGMFRVGWDGAWFTNDIKALVWDNPSFLTDYNNGRTPPSGPYDPSGYSNGNGPARGRQSTAPDNSMNVVSASGLYKLARRSSVNGTLQFTQQTQDETLIPWTINPVIDSPVVHAAFPHLAALPRATAMAEAKGVNALLNFSSRPYRGVNVTARYRYNKRDVQTPTFDATEYVRFDAVPEEIEEGFSHQYDNSRRNFDANVAFTPGRWGTVRVGYGHEAVERHGRGFADVGEHIFRMSFDAISMQYVSVRAGFDVGRRRGDGFVETGIDYELGPGGTQPTLRYYDEADRNRTRGSVVVTAMPMDTVDFFVSFAGWKDEYLADPSAPVERAGELFGLQDSRVTSWGFGVNASPMANVMLGASYGREKYSALQLSRNANPPPDPSWTDPNRNWNLDNDETTNNFNVFVDVLRAVRNTDIRVAYDFSDSNNSYVHGGPRIAALTTAGQFIPLPDVENTWHRLTADVRYFFTDRAGLGIGYYFDKLDVVDFNTVDTEGPVGFASATGVPRIDWLGALITGYGNRPYTGSTFSLRALYRF